MTCEICYYDFVHGCFRVVTVALSPCPMRNARIKQMHIPVHFYIVSMLKSPGYSARNFMCMKCYEIFRNEP